MIISKNFWKIILTCMVAGSATGLLLSPTGAALVPEGAAMAAAEWLALPGVIFLGLIGMVIIPLVVTSIILGINTSHDPEYVKRLGFRIIPYFVITALIAVLIGIGLAELFKPGLHGAGDAQIAVVSVQINPDAEAAVENLTIPDRIANLVPSNVLLAAVQHDFLLIVIASILVGLVVLNLSRIQMKGFLDLCEVGQAISTKIIEWAMKLAPAAVFGLMASALVKSGPGAFIGLGGYVFTVLAGLACIIVLYLLIVTFIGKRNPLEFLRHCREVMLLAFSTSSSAAVMPVTLQTAEQKLGIEPQMARFIVPLGTTLNMDGTGIYQAIAAVFLCQFYGIDLTFAESMLLALTMVGASIGTPATPGVGIVVLAAIVSKLGVPPEGIGLILGVDRILDMCRTTVNVMGDLTASTVMARWMKKEAKEA